MKTFVWLTVAFLFTLGIITETWNLIRPEAGVFGTCGGTISDQVMEALNPSLYARDADSDERLQAIEVEIIRIREWAKSIQDKCVRQNYLWWLDQYEKSIVKIRQKRRSVIPLPPGRRPQP